MSTCIWPGCNLIAERFMHCFKHADLLAIPKPEKGVYKIPQRSAKRIKEQPIYRKIVAEVLEEDNSCKVRQEGCQWIASGMNHIVKRSPATWLKQDNLIPCCDSCNRWIENNPEEAIKKGFSKSKF